jgi:hypothetical protein
VRVRKEISDETRKFLLGRLAAASIKVYILAGSDMQSQNSCSGRCSQCGCIVPRDYRKSIDYVVGSHDPGLKCPYILANVELVE